MGWQEKINIKRARDTCRQLCGNFVVQNSISYWDPRKDNVDICVFVMGINDYYAVYEPQGYFQY